MADEDVLFQADALMRRHRCADAQPPSPGEADPLRHLTDDGNIPLLTEIVPGPAPVLDETLDDLHREIEKTVSRWLIDTLPVAIANASQHILAEVDAKARLTLLPQVQALIHSRRDKGQ